MAFKVRKGQKEALNAPGRHVSPEPKIKWRDPIVGPYILKKFQIDTTLLTPSKKVVTELVS